MGAGAIPLAAAAPRTWVQSGTDRQNRPNILFICTDYQSGEDGPSLGSPFLQMPALDRLCRNGVVFTRHYSNAPICMPARYTWITGQYPHTHGKWGNNAGWLPKDSPVLMELLGQNGYYSVGIGKMHFDPWDRTAGFSRRITADRKGNLESDKDYPDDYSKFLASRGLSRWDYLKLQYESPTPHVYDWPFPVECHIDHYVGTQARQVIESDELDNHKPWFLWVSFNGPHNPWDPPARYSRPYLQMKLPTPRTYLGELRSRPVGNTDARYNYTKEVADYTDRYPERAAGYIHRIRAGHYGNLTLIDEQVRGMLAALERKGKINDTIIIYSADHGGLLGDHGCFHKGLIYERSARVPFVVHCPALFKPRRTPAFNGHVDVLPTILSLAGVPVPAAVEGHDLTPILAGRQQSVQDQAFIEISDKIGIVTDRWKMFVHPRAEGELYDLNTDPDELKNLYGDANYGSVRAQLRDRLLRFHPAFASRFDEKPLNPPEVRSEYTFRHGNVFREAQEPFPPPQAGKAIHLRATLKPSGDVPLNGAFFVCEEMIPTWPARDPQNGYALYIRDGLAAMGVRLWDQDTVITADEALPTGEVVVEGALMKDGAMTLRVGGRIVASGKAPGCLPIRRGRPEVLAPNIHVGVGHKWGRPIGLYNHTENFQGEIREVVLRLE